MGKGTIPVIYSLWEVTKSRSESAAAFRQQRFISDCINCKAFCSRGDISIIFLHDQVEETVLAEISTSFGGGTGDN